MDDKELSFEEKRKKSKEEFEQLRLRIQEAMPAIREKILEETRVYEERKKNGTLKPPPKNGFCD